jgi:hypothetical protein
MSTTLSSRELSTTVLSALVDKLRELSEAVSDVAARGRAGAELRSEELGTDQSIDKHRVRARDKYLDSEIERITAKRAESDS